MRTAKLRGCPRDAVCAAGVGCRGGIECGVARVGLYDGEQGGQDGRSAGRRLSPQREGRKRLPAGGAVLLGLARLRTTRRAIIRKCWRRSMPSAKSCRGTSLPRSKCRTSTMSASRSSSWSRLDPEKYRPEIECLLQFLHARQKKHGGWGYYEQETGDTSMTQYGVLSSWEAKQAGFNISPDSMEAVTNWLAGHARPQRRIRLPGENRPRGAVSWGKRKSAAA